MAAFRIKEKKYIAADGLPWSGFAPRPACAGHPQPFLVDVLADE